jgi:hypothetical protein
MYKGASRFSRARAFSGRRLSGCPRTRKFGSGSDPQSRQIEFAAGTAYITKLSPAVRPLVKRALAYSQIADELSRRGIASPSGNPWTATLVNELVIVVELTDNQKSRPGWRRGRRQPTVQSSSDSQ